MVSYTGDSFDESAAKVTNCLSLDGFRMGPYNHASIIALYSNLGFIIDVLRASS